ncbi:MAG: 50S ribosomal protein L17 [Candidatus Kapabacteria bacterium]|nr:50S ribosomal protein L17 [Candidatus Kapabacteria bacterium]
MRHLKKGRKLKRTWSHRKSLLSNLATSLIIQDEKRIKTTLAKAKELRPFIEGLITKAKNAVIRERNGEFANGHVDVHQRREVAKVIRSKEAVQELFDTIALTVLERNGGYTRIIKLGQRRGDGAEEAIIQLVDFAPKQDGATSTRRKTKSAKAPKAAPVVAAVTETVADAPVVEEIKDVVTEIAEAPETVADAVEETVADVAVAAEEASDAAPESAAEPEAPAAEGTTNEGEEPKA